MIKLTNLLTEISLNTVTPYATQFAWRDRYGDGEVWESQFTAESQPIVLSMQWWSNSRLTDSGEWQFSYFVRGANDQGWTTNAAVGTARGKTNIFRLFKTIGYALRDFIDSQSSKTDNSKPVNVIDITGSDSAVGKSEQKSRIYAELIRSSNELTDFELLHGAQRLFLVRKNMNKPQADASGIDTPNNPNM